MLMLKDNVYPEPRTNSHIGSNVDDNQHSGYEDCHKQIADERNVVCWNTATHPGYEQGYSWEDQS